MRRRTQWAVFTSMNRQQSAWRSLYEPAERTGSTDTPGDTTTGAVSTPDPESRTASDTRSDRVEFM